MKANKLLSITVPTFNRAEILDYFLSVNIPKLAAYNIQIFISDNASTDNTNEIVLKWIRIYPYLKYYKNEVNVGMDRNFELALNYSDSEYTWLFGDTYILPDDGISLIISKIESHSERFDAIIVNLKNRVNGTQPTVYSNSNCLLSDLGWHVTCISCNIFKKDLIDSANFQRYYSTDLAHVGVLFEYIATKTFSVLWEPNIVVQSSPVKSKVANSWFPQVFEIWLIKWPNLIYSLPVKYELSSKIKCISDHNVKSKLMSFSGLLNLRALGILDTRAYQRYSNVFPISVSVSRPVVFLIAMTPRFPLRIARSTYMFLRAFSRRKVELRTIS